MKKDYEKPVIELLELEPADDLCEEPGAIASRATIRDY
jgi:hypothetical protein